MLLLYSILFILGTCIGSFITCMAERTCSVAPVPDTNRSFCPHCYHRLRPWQLIPLLGVLLQRGRCFDCQRAINLRSTYLELLCGGLLVVTYPHDFWTSAPLLLGYGVLLFNSITDQLNFAVYPYTLVLPGILGLLHHRPIMSVPLLILIGLLVVLFCLARYTDKFGMGDVDVLILLACLAPPTAVITSLTLAAVAALVVFTCRRHPGRLSFVPFITWGFIFYTQLLS